MRGEMQGDLVPSEQGHCCVVWDRLMTLVKCQLISLAFHLASLFPDKAVNRSNLSKTNMKATSGAGV